ncbi:MAG TPA: FAD-binding protein [Bacteroidales bacterium]|nr:MAG: FAD-binding protein [Bacteroidetes bacterium GWF2_33_38]HBF87623.1 FAD-binding protein [Bacteroidales bacterium]
MAIAHKFEYVKPSKLDEALEVLSKFGAEASVLAGGTDFAVRLKEHNNAPKMLVDIKGINELKTLKLENGTLKIGALVTFSELIASEIIKQNFPLIHEASTTVASIGTRNRATIVGNICSAVPSLDSGPALLVYEADVLLKSKSGERKVSIKDWFTGPKRTAIAVGEIVVGLEIKLPSDKNGTSYIKLGRYRGEDLAQAGIGVMVTDKKQYKIAFCALGPVPVRAKIIEDLLNGKEIDDKIIAEAKLLVDKVISPITDIRSSKEYRMHIAKVMLERGLLKAKERITGVYHEKHDILGG